MIRELELKDKNEYYKLGAILNPNFMKAYNLDAISMKEYEKVYGYYLNETLIGFIHIQISFDEADIVNIVVNEKYRRNHIGTKLIDFCLNKHDLKALNLEARENNPAVEFYQKLGFKTLRTIPHYYSDKTNAKFMKKVI